MSMASQYTLDIVLPSRGLIYGSYGETIDPNITIRNIKSSDEKEIYASFGPTAIDFFIA